MKRIESNIILESVEMEGKKCVYFAEKDEQKCVHS